MLIGATINQQCINRKLCDELHIGIMPVMLGDGLRLFEHLQAPEQMALEKIRVFEDGPRTDIWFSVTY